MHVMTSDEIHETVDSLRPGDQVRVVYELDGDWVVEHVAVAERYQPDTKKIYLDRDGFVKVLALVEIVEIENRSHR